MTESEAAALIDKLRRAKRRWQLAAISLLLLMAILVGNTVTMARLATARAAAEQQRAYSAELKARQAIGARQGNHP
jgi:hypothetical protein